ncbi:hypothetical protein ACQJBY_069786 [Aegilops geniculata]
MAYSKGAGGGGMSAVDAILAEAADLVALEQIARLNTAHLAGLDDSALPSSLESRFRKLKSLPTAAPAPPAKTLGRSATAPPQRRDDPPADPLPQPHADPPAPVAPASQEQSPPPQPQANPRKTSVPAVREDGDEEEEGLERLFGAGRGRPTLREPNRGRDDDGSLSPPPPRQACCFPFSPKKAPQRAPTARSRKDRVGGAPGDVLSIDAGEWGDENRKMVTELKEQQRKLKKALEEQVKVSRETAKMARWVKQASARMTHTDAIDDLLSDIDDDDELK